MFPGFADGSRTFLQVDQKFNDAGVTSCPGVELLMSEVYDSAFSGLRSPHSFAQTNIYRVLQRRMLGVRLALTGHFRCKQTSKYPHELCAGLKDWIQF